MIVEPHASAAAAVVVDDDNEDDNGVVCDSAALSETTCASSLPTTPLVKYPIEKSTKLHLMTKKLISIKY